MESKIHLIILAAGKGTRMLSDLPKVMHTVGSLPLLGHVLKATQAFQKHALPSSFEKSQIHVVLSSTMEAVANFVHQHIPAARIVYQTEQLGTAHAVSCTLKDFPVGPEDAILVLFGDTPLIQHETLRHMVEALTKADLLVGGMRLQNPKAYGRLVTDAMGALLKIVEYKHASTAEKEINLCNSGVMAFRGACLTAVLPLIQPQALHGEYYLTDAVALALQQKFTVHSREVSVEEVEGVNTRADLAEAEELFQQHRRQEMLAQGVTLIAPETVFFAHDTIVERDVFIEPNVYFGPGVVVKSGSVIKAFSHLEGAVLEEGATVGPFARLRPGTVIGTGARIGNFVEVKNATFAQGAKANHLSYVGDATVGAGANIGAGTITCNYDGYFKHETHIAEGAFIGSNTCLVAPVSIGAHAIVGAASTITKDVARDALAVARAPQKDFEGKARQIHAQKLKLKEKVA